jgi:hypothetical protein
LRVFGGARGDTVVYELGSEKREDNTAYFLSLRIGALDSVGHSALTIRCSNNRSAPDKEVVEFSIRAQVADINRLGRLLEAFSQLRHRVLEWDLQEGRLKEHDEPEAEQIA